MNLDHEAKLDFLCMYTATIDPKLEVQEHYAEERGRTLHLFRSVREPLHREGLEEQDRRRRVPVLVLYFHVDIRDNVFISAKANEKYTDNLLATLTHTRSQHLADYSDNVTLYVIEPGGQLACGVSQKVGANIIIKVSIRHTRISRILNTIKQMVKQVFHSA